jgi:hypothetical protein
MGRALVHRHRLPARVLSDVPPLSRVLPTDRADHVQENIGREELALTLPTLLAKFVRIQNTIWGRAPTSARALLDSCRAPRWDCASGSNTLVQPGPPLALVRLAFCRRYKTRRFAGTRLRPHEAGQVSGCQTSPSVGMRSMTPCGKFRY